MMDMPERKPCYHCGSGDVWMWKEGTVTYARCMGCGADRPIVRSMTIEQMDLPPRLPST